MRRPSDNGSQFDPAPCGEYICHEMHKICNMFSSCTYVALHTNISSIICIYIYILDMYVHV